MKTSSLEEISKSFAQQTQAKKDELIKQAINSTIGNDWVIGDLAERGEFIILHDKTEVFKLDGVELIRFTSPKIEYNHSRKSTAVKLTQGVI